jgi:hypothetical protein
MDDDWGESEATAVSSTAGNYGNGSYGGGGGGGGGRGGGGKKLYLIITFRIVIHHT